MTFKGTKKKTGEIASEVNVRYVLEGSVRKAGNNLRITAQLIDGINDTHLWAEKYSGTLDDIFDIQEKVSQSIADELKIKLSSQEKMKIYERPIDNVFAYDCYKRAFTEIQSFIRERVDYGLKLLQKGLSISGENAVIYAGIAMAYWQYVNLGIEPEKNLKKAEEYLEKALNLDHELAEAHTVMGGLSIANGDIVKAIDHLLRANANKPKDPIIMVWLAFFYSIIGRSDTGMSLINDCIKVDPVNPANELMTGCNYFFNGRFDLALDPTLAAYELAPESGMYQFWKALVLFYNDRTDEAYEFISEFVEEPGRDINTQVTIFLKYAIRRERDKLTSMLTPDLVKAIQMDFQMSYHVATFFSYLDENEKSLEFLENAVNRGFINYPLIAELDPFLENIRREERFKKLMERVKYEWENFEG